MEAVQKVKDFFLQRQDPKELVRKWQSEMRSQQRALDRQIRDIQLEEKKVQKSIKEAAKRNDLGSAKHLAKEIVQSRRTISRLYTNKAQLISLNTSLTEQLAMIRVAGTLGKSSEVMKLVNDMVKLPELRSTMMEMSKEMMKAGLIEEMMNDTLDSALDTEDMEEETEAEVDKVLAELMGETMAALPASRLKPLPQRQQQQAAQEEEGEEEGADELGELQARLNAIRS